MVHPFRSAVAGTRVAVPACAVVVGFAVHPVSSPGHALDSDSGTVVAIIPARYHSTRLPGKALADIGGRPMIEHVYRRASAAALVSSVLVATDDPRIADAVHGFGGTACLTSANHPSGTDRLAEVAAGLPCSIVVNVQGDEPLLAASMIDEAIAPLLADHSVMMSTLRREIDDPADLHDPNVTKVVVDRDGFALYFSRAPIPYVRAGSPAPRTWRHIGLYVYRRDCLLELARLQPTPLERAESLEQLRALEHGIRILAVETKHDSVGVDTPADLDRVRRLFQEAAQISEA